LLRWRTLCGGFFADCLQLSTLLDQRWAILVRVQPEDWRPLGVTLLDYQVFWSDNERVEIDVAAIGLSESEAASRR
jgi:hypothetical protein